LVPFPALAETLITLDVGAWTRSLASEVPEIALHEVLIGDLPAGLEFPRRLNQPADSVRIAGSQF
jgi:hypothetical protein